MFHEHVTGVARNLAERTIELLEADPLVIVKIESSEAQPDVILGQPAFDLVHELLELADVQLSVLVEVVLLVHLPQIVVLGLQPLPQLSNDSGDTSECPGFLILVLLALHDVLALPQWFGTILVEALKADST